MWDWKAFKPCVILPGSPSRAEKLQYDKRVFARCNGSSCMDKFIWRGYCEFIGQIVRVTGENYDRDE